jgi:uncharacterized protein YndB with AHSA1/START domain
MRFETSVDIAAAPSRIWSTWVDVEHWPDWTASVESAERLDDGAFGVGSRVRLKQPKMRATEWEVTELEPDRSYVWSARSGGMSMVAGHTIEPGADRQMVRLTFELTGPLSGLFGRLAGGRIRRYLDMEANGVKSHCEA